MDSRQAAPVRLDDDTISVGRFFSVDFQRTLRLPDDGREYPLPPGFGRFPLRAVTDFADRIPSEWLERGGFILPMHRHEALWLLLDCPYWRAVAVSVEIGGVCALTGQRNAATLDGDPQNYMVVPEQPWLDGIKAGEGMIRQFVAAPLGDGVTVEAQLTGAERVGGIQITVVEPKAGLFPTEPPAGAMVYAGEELEAPMMICESSAMGLGAGGRMRQSIYPDPHGVETWDLESALTVNIHLVDARDWHAITGEEPPESPIGVDAYRRLGLPWFSLDDAHLGDLPVLPALAGIKPVPFD